MEVNGDERTHRECSITRWFVQTFFELHPRKILHAFVAGDAIAV